LRLGLAYLGLYRLNAGEWLAEAVPDAAERAALSDPLWLLGVAHDGREAGRAVTPGELLEHDPIRRLLVPAARCFLEARRCAAGAAIAHAGIAVVSPLLEGADSPSVYAARALSLAGADGPVIAMVAEVAMVAGDRALAARAWKRALDVDDSRWSEVADAAGATLPAGEILDSVATEGRHALWFAGRLYAAPEDRATRDRFLRAALARLPYDRGPSPPERLRLEATAWAALDERARARRCMEDALRLEPDRLDWRKELIAWLLDWGQAQEAHDHALIGAHLAPDRPDARATLEQTARALAAGPAAESDRGAKTPPAYGTAPWPGR
jgi:tetratricopeptide (TPR) repeat protein